MVVVVLRRLVPMAAPSLGPLSCLSNFDGVVVGIPQGSAQRWLLATPNRALVLFVHMNPVWHGVYVVVDHI